MEGQNNIVFKGAELRIWHRSYESAPNIENTRPFKFLYLHYVENGINSSFHKFKTFWNIPTQLLRFLFLNVCNITLWNMTVLWIFLNGLPYIFIPFLNCTLTITEIYHTFDNLQLWRSIIFFCWSMYSWIKKCKCSFVQNGNSSLIAWKC